MIDVMEKKIALSVIVPVYNSAKTLARALHSLLEEQTLKEDYQVILELDPSKDNSLEIAKAFQTKHPLLEIDAPEKRMGIGLARLRGLEKVKGEYFYFMDADDYLTPDCLETLLTTIRKTQADCVNCSFRYIQGKHHRAHFFPWSKNATLNRKQAMKTYFADSYMRGFCWTKIYKSEIAKQRPLLVVGAPLDMQFEDVALNCSLLSYCHKVVIIKKPLYYYDRSLGESAMLNKRTNRAFRHVVVFALERYFLELTKDEEGLEGFRKELYRSALSLDFDLLYDRQAGASKAYAKQVRAAFKLLKNMKKPLVAKGSFFETDAANAVYFR